MEDIKLIFHMVSGSMGHILQFRRHLSCMGLESQTSLDGHPSPGPFQHIAQVGFCFIS